MTESPRFLARSLSYAIRLGKSERLGLLWRRGRKSGNRGARPGGEVRSGHSSVPSTLPDSKGVMVGRRAPRLLCQPRSGPSPCVWHLVSSPEGLPYTPACFLPGSKSTCRVLEALILVGCVAKTRLLSSLSQVKHTGAPFRTFSTFTESVCRQVEIEG